MIINETGSGYLPPKSSVPQYPAILQLSDVLVANPGINYDCGVDEIVIEPANGTQLSYVCEPFGKISGVKILKAGNFTDLPTIRMKTKTGVNAAFTPVFDVVRDPVPVEPVIYDIGQVFDLVGLNVNGFIGGKDSEPSRCFSFPLLMDSNKSKSFSTSFGLLMDFFFKV